MRKLVLAAIMAASALVPAAAFAQNDDHGRPAHLSLHLSAVFSYVYVRSERIRTADGNDSRKVPLFAAADASIFSRIGGWLTRNNSEAGSVLP